LKRTPPTELKLVLAGATANEVKDAMPRKVKSPIEVTPLGIVKVVKPESRKAPVPND
jgi:hypothetical protein